MTNIDETVAEFLMESIENLDRLDQALIALEENPADIEVVNEIFRIVHTVKGTSGFFDFRILEGLSHVGENLLDSLRSNRIAVSQKIISGLLLLGDALRMMIVNIEHTGREGDREYAELKSLLTELNAPAAENCPPQDTKPAEPEPAAVIKRSTMELECPPAADELSKMFEEASDEYRRNQEGGAEPQAQAEPEYSPAPHSEPEQIVSAEAPAESPGPEALLQKSAEGKKSDLADSVLRVDVALLDKLMNLVGELVLARNQILQFTKNQSDSEFVGTSQRLNLITSELQEGVMRTRMQPIANVWNKLPRIVRDVAAACGKQVELEMYGKETELDKTIIEAIKDPLTHIIRNAVDHGIETPSVRSSSGKNPCGLLKMKAFHEGGQVIIEISDNGSGLNADRIRSKAVERGIITADKAAGMPDHEIQRLIFLPGFSTAEKITNISGRGVGMDVVRSNIEKIGGTIDVSGRFGEGTTFTIKIPLTLAIIPALIVTAASNRYAIPQVNLLELVRIEGAHIRNNLEEIHGSVFYRLRGKLLPIIRLREELRVDAAREAELKDEAVLSIVVVKADNLQFGLVVDAIFDTEEIVVKPLGKLLKAVEPFAGATIMGDGRVALILDVGGLAKQAQITKKESALQEEMQDGPEGRSDRKKLLIFETAPERRAAIDLEQVHRLEEFERRRVERTAGRMVVQYRGAILPLIDLRESAPGSGADEGPVKAFVCFDGASYVGFVVKNIIDIVEQSVKVENPFRRAGTTGCAVIQGAVTDLIDLHSVVSPGESQFENLREAACRNQSR